MQINTYKKFLSNLTVPSDDLVGFKKALVDYRIKTEHQDDYYSWISAVFALYAIADNNFGIGSVLVDERENIIAEGHNQVFRPYFRSDRHAEMVVLNTFEDKVQHLSSRQAICVEQYTLYTSLEPCPMCSARIITSGIGNIKFTVADDTGGFTKKINEFPAAWQELTNEPYKQYFSQADCSEELISISSNIFLYNADRLNTELRRIYKSNS